MQEDGEGEQSVSEPEPLGMQAFDAALTPSEGIKYETAEKCSMCSREFGFFSYSYNCETCGKCFCSDCSRQVAPVHDHDDDEEDSLLDASVRVERESSMGDARAAAWVYKAAPLPRSWRRSIYT